MNNLEKLLYLTGVSAEYFDYSGNRHEIPWEDRLRLLQELGHDPTDAHAIERAIFDLDAKPWLSWLQPCHIVSLGTSEYLDVRLPLNQLAEPIKWRLETESGETRESILVPADLAEVGEYNIGDVRHSARRLPLPDLPPGYHRIELENARRQECASLLVAPERCFEGGPEQQRLWGISCQLYTLRSARDWGMGDFTDLAELVELAADAAMDVVAINPLHAPHMSGADFASPYSPSDRRFLNPLYIDPEQVDDYRACADASGPQHEIRQRQSSELRALDHVDYDAVTALKYPVFAQMFQHFLAHHVEKRTARAADFDAFVRSQGERLQSFSGFESRHDGLTLQSARDPRFHQYLQWLADQQLGHCQRLALRRGMKIGLMRDLALGSANDGAEVVGNPTLFCKNAALGAPPDPLAEQGQNWALPAPHPVAMRATGYRHFIDLLRTNMVDCGALRIDHVLGLLRLWWCLPGHAGAYVYYPLEDLLAILRLESDRNRCLVVGEDMGVVPDHLRERMRATGVLGNKLFYFEKTPEGAFKPPQDHQADALLMVTNHDVPTLAGWWDGTDIKLRAEIGLLDEQRDVPSATAQRNAERGQLLSWLQAQGLLPEQWADFPLEKPFDLALCGAILKANARSRSRMMLFQIDDLQLQRPPVNVPGTYREYPNWRRKLTIETRTLFNDAAIRTLLSSIHQERNQ